MNVDDDTDRSNYLVPFIGVEGDGLVWRTDTGDDDNGTDYSARIITKPYVHGNLLHQFEVQNGSLMARASQGATINVTVIGNFGLFEKLVEDIDLSHEDDEERVIRPLDELGLAELNTVQVEFEDPDTPGTRWQLEQFYLKETAGQGS